MYDWAETREVPLTDTLHTKARRPQKCGNKCMGSTMDHQGTGSGIHLPAEEKLTQAADFLEEYYRDVENHGPPEKGLEERLAEVLAELKRVGYYDLSEDELLWGARTAWRNADRCPARVVWKKLQVYDCRHMTTTDQMAEALVRHTEESLNTGNIQPAISIFRERRPGKKDLRVWNGLVLGFAGYEQEDGSVVGDPSSVNITKIAEGLGWRGAGGMFDLLPWVLSGEDGVPRLYSVPQRLIDTLPITVDIKHPTYEGINEMGLKWFTLPGVASMMAEIGGNQFTAAPFAGWYQETEISTRDLLDPQRYNLLEPLGHAMKLDMSSNTTLWKDVVSLELSRAVLESFKNARVSIVDHYTQADQFMEHLAAEYKERGGCPADWVWIVPPTSGSLVPTYHQEMLRYKLSPSYEYQENPSLALKPKNTLKFKTLAWTMLLGRSITNHILKSRKKVTILYGTETGQSKRFCNQAMEIFMSSFTCVLLPLDSPKVYEQIANSDLTIFISSTFGNGEAPNMAEAFNLDLKTLLLDSAETKSSQCTVVSWCKDVNFAVFGLGSSAYVDLAAFGKFIDSAMTTLGGKQLVPLGVGDELKHQKTSFQNWIAGTFKAALKMFNIQVSEDKMSKVLSEVSKEYRWEVRPKGTVNINASLSEISRYQILDVTLTKKVPLHAELEEANSFLLDFTYPETAGQGPTYLPGDHLGLFPTNRKADVVFLEHRLSDCPPSMDEPLQLMETTTGKRWKEVVDFPKFMRFDDLLSNFCDLRLPSQDVLKMFLKYAKQQDQAMLKKLVTDQDAYEKWALKGSTFCDALREFPSVMLPSAELMGTLPNILSRLYSIASSPKVKGSVSLVVTTAHFKTADGLTHKGLCSGQLEMEPKGTKMSAFFKSVGSFKLPKDPSLPVIMIAAGSGIAPFRGFWEERQHQAKTGTRVGETILLMGCRKESMNLLKEETKTIKEFNFKHLTAVSREEGKPRKYVQDLVREQGALLHKLWLEEGGSLYVCGKVAMAKGVQEALEEVFQQWGGKEKDAARRSIQELKAEGRYMEDIFTA